MNKYDYMAAYRNTWENQLFVEFVSIQAHNQPLVALVLALYGIVSYILQPEISKFLRIFWWDWKYLVVNSTLINILDIELNREIIYTKVKEKIYFKNGMLEWLLNI